MQTALLWAASGTGFTFLMTTLGAASVFLFRKRNSMAIQRALLAFSAGAMMYVVVEELIPEAHLGEHSNVGTLGVMAGFLVMMVLDVALG